MIFRKTALEGAFMIELEQREDERGSFARTFCRREFEARGLSPNVAQSSVATNRHKGTLRGLHFQFPPMAESKLVRCTRGAMLDVIVDLRPESATYLQHAAFELTADNQRALYVPERFAHGYQVLCDTTDVTYQMNEFFAPGAEGGLRYDDARLGIRWPLPASIVSPRDQSFPLLAVAERELRLRMSLR